MMRHALRAFVGLVLPVLWMCGPRGPCGHALADPKETDDIRGRVLDLATGRPVAGARVSLWRRDRAAPVEEFRAPLEFDWPATPARSVRTDSAGGFAFREEPRAPLRWVTVSADGYAPAAADATAAGARPEIALEAAESERKQLLQLGPDGPEPAKAAELLVLTDGPPRLLAARVPADADGFVSTALGEQAMAVAVAPGCGATRVRIGRRDAELLAPGGAVTGVVRAVDGDPLPRAHVSVDARGGIEMETRTDGQGRFRLEHVPAGPEPAGLLVEAEGCAPLRMQVCGGDADLSLTVTPGANLRGRVLHADDSPAAGRQVFDADARDSTDTLFTRPGDIDRAVTTDADGSFLLAGVPPGLRAVGAGSLVARTVEVLPGRDPPVFTLRMPAPATLRVRVLDEARRPVPEILVGDAMTGPDGAANVVLSSPAIEISGGPLEEPRRVDLRATAVDGGTVTVLLSESAEAKLRVLDAKGREVRPMFMVVVPVDEGAEIATFSELGRVGPRGVIVPASGRFRLALAFEGADGPVTNVSEHDASEVVEGVLDVRLPDARVVGRVPETYAHEGIDVVAAPVEGEDHFEGRIAYQGACAEDGRFVIAGLPPGRWSVLVRTRTDVPRLLVARTVEVRGDEEVDLGTTPEPVLLRGRVRSGEDPVVGALLEFRAGATPGTATIANADGRYALEVPAAAEGLLVAGRAGYGSVAAHVRPGAETVYFKLEPEARLLLRNARDALGQPLRLRVRAGGVEHRVRVARPTREAIVERIAPGPVEIVFDDGPGERVVKAQAISGRMLEVDLAAR